MQQPVFMPVPSGSNPAGAVPAVSYAGAAGAQVCVVNVHVHVGHMLL